MVRIIAFVITFLRLMVAACLFALLNQSEIFYIINEKIYGFFDVFLLFLLLFLTWKIPFEKLFRIRFNFVDKAISYYLWGCREKKKIKINEHCYIVIYNIEINHGRLSLFQENNNSWNKYYIDSFIFYEDLKIYCRRISNDTLLIFAYYISSNKNEKSDYQIKDYLNHSFSKEIIEIVTSLQTKKLVYFYTTLKINPNAYSLTINDKKINLK